MADNTQLNIPTTTGNIIASDEVVIGLQTVQVQRIKVHLGTDGTSEGDVGAGNPLPVTPGSGAVFTVSGTVALAGGTATVGTVNVASGAGFFLKTATGGNIPADTTSGLGVKFVSAQPITIEAGTATVGTVALQAAAAVALNAGTATIGNVNLSSGAGIYLKTSTGGDIPADTTSGLAVKFVNAQSVNATLQAGTATVGVVTVNSLPAGTATIGSVALGAGTATVGTVVLNALPAGTATIGSVVLGAGTATAGTVHLATTEAVCINTQPSTATDSRGPKTVAVTTSGTTALVTAGGASVSNYITCIMANNTATTVSAKLSISDGTTRVRSSLAANGGGYVLNFNPPWKLPGNTALNASIGTTADIDITIMFYTGAT